MIRVHLSPQCTQLSRDFGLSVEHIVATVNNRDRGLVTDGLDRIVAAHWFTDEQLVIVDTIVTKKDVEGTSVSFQEVTVQLALVLSANLPTGQLSRGASMTELLSVVANAFGLPVRCHDQHPSSTLYSGPWDGRPLVVDSATESGSFFTVGTFYPSAGRCELVWAFSLDRYMTWQADAFSRGLAPIPNTILRQSMRDLTRMVRAIRLSFPDFSPLAVQYALASIVLRSLLGDDWCAKQLPGTAEAHPRFRQVDQDQLTRMKAQAWTIDLGELLFNLQQVPGFISKLTRLRDCDLESAVAELHAARSLIESGLEPHFVRERGKRGNDYEMDVTLPNGMPACCEVKSKGESTPLSAATVRNSLKDAARQVPASTPSIIFLKLPYHWIPFPNDQESKTLLEAVVRSETERFFAANQRVVALVLFWEEWHRLDNGGLARQFKFRELPNTLSRFYDAATAYLIRGMETQPQHQPWVRFDAVAREAIN